MTWKRIAIVFIILWVIALIGNIHGRSQPVEHATLTLETASKTIHLTDDDGEEIGSFTLGEQVTITFKRAK